MRDDDPRFTPLGQFTPEGRLTPGYGDGYLFFAGRDDIHQILLALIAAETMGLKLSMFGFDDQALNDAVVTLMADPNVAVQVSLDKSQAAGVTERKILAADLAADPDLYNSWAVLTSATHQLNHTKGGVLTGQGLWFEGSVNWSASGEGTGIKTGGGKQPAGYVAQNNTLTVSGNPVGMARFAARLDTEHLQGLNRAGLPTPGADPLE